MAGSDFIVPLCKEEPEILYGDEQLLLVNKPPGLLSVPGRHPQNRDALISRLQIHWPQALIVHRLDMDTSGIMVIALSREAHSNLSKQFERRQVTKTYEAIVPGVPFPEEGSIDLPLITDWPNRPLQKVCFENGKPSLTRYKVLEINEEASLSKLLLVPETGRSHQLRLHLKAFGHPILGDNFYAPESVRSLSARLLLHAKTLTLKHPTTDETIEGLAETPFSLEGLTLP
jgi:tRNA pseudouridine32 synthase/23S rRNA pseudouridine746 synthase